MEEKTNKTTLAGLKKENLPSSDVKIGFENLASFELLQRAATLLANSTLVPPQFQLNPIKVDRYGKVTEVKSNPNAISNCVIVLNMAQRMNADPLMIAQNLYVIEGRPSWSSQWIIAAINTCGRFTPLQFELRDEGEKNVIYESFEYVDGKRVEKKETIKIRDKSCYAWAKDKQTGEVVESSVVSIEMAVKEGWYTKKGSKWRTMEDVMLRYRAAAFFGKIYAPEILMGIPTSDEARDITFDAERDFDGTYSVNLGEMKSANVDLSTGEIIDKPYKNAHKTPVEENKDITPQETPPESEKPPRQPPQQPPQQEQKDNNDIDLG